MKRFTIAIALGVFVLIVIGWFLRKPPIGRPASSLSSAAVSQRTALAPQSAGPDAPSAPAPSPSAVTMESKAEKMQSLWEATNATPQDFYGKVVDQKGNPIPDVEVVGELGWIQGATLGPKTETHRTASNAQGEFEFTGISGWQLGIQLHKSGYEIARNNDARQMPEGGKTSSANRALFTMWKLQGPEPMIHTLIEAGLSCDGKSRNFDLQEGRRDVGNFVVTLTRNPLNVEPGKPFDWTLTMSVNGGGLIEDGDLYPNEAPADEYRSVTVKMNVSDNAWSDSLQKTYYIYDGKTYGRVTVHLTASYQPPPTHVRFDAFINSSGSRNLEYDKKLQINP